LRAKRAMEERERYVRAEAKRKAEKK